MSKVAKAPEPTVTSIIREVWEVHPGDMPGAAEGLYQSIITNPSQLNRLVPTILKTWCREQISDYVRHLRIVSLEPVKTEDQQGERLRAVITATLFDFPLPGGKRLGDANAREIQEGAQAYQDTATDAGHKARWLALVAAKVGRKNRAETALSLSEVENLFEEART